MAELGGVRGKVMEIYGFISENRNKIESAYDLAALCYDYLMTQIQSNKQTVFIAEYIDFPEETDDEETHVPKGNPNIEMLRKFTDDVFYTLLKDYLDMDVLLDDILDFVSSAKHHLQNYENEAYNKAAIAYYLLMAINLYAGNCTKSSDPAPLNRNYQTNAYIYRCRADGMMATNLMSQNLGDPILPMEIRNDFHHLKILEKAELKDGMNPPQMVTLSVDKNHVGMKRIIKNQRLNVAIIPFGRKDICEFVPKERGGFRIRYPDEYLQSNIEKAKKLLELAICEGANIIVFPEYVCFPEMQDAIGDYLRDIAGDHSNRLNNLLLVVAGSGWTSDDNNVSIVFSSGGTPLGKHYKCEAYHKEIETEIKNKEGSKKRIIRHIEGLEDPGKESVIIQIPGLGSVMPAICRDISNRDLIETLARVFCIDFLMIPAWSNSLHKAFEDQLCNITSANRNTCAVVCNGCGGIEEKYWKENRERGLVVVPCKKGHRIAADPTMISVDEEDHAGCFKCGGCIFSLSLHLRIQDIESGKNLEKEQIFLG